MRYMSAIGLLAVVMGCGAGPDEFRELRDGQREIRAKLTDLEKKVDQLVARPAAAPQAAGQADPNKVYSIPAGDSPFKGVANAPVTLVEFSDFQCPYCAQIPSAVEEVLKVYPKEVKVVYKQLPLTTIHPNALNAARASLAAQRQGKFWEMHDVLFKNQNALQPEKLKEYAQQIGLNMKRFETDMASPEVQKQIDEENKVAEAAQVTGTPTLFVNGKRAKNRSAEGLKQMVDEALKQKG